MLLLTCFFLSYKQFIYSLLRFFIWMWFLNGDLLIEVFLFDQDFFVASFFVSIQDQNFLEEFMIKS